MKVGCHETKLDVVERFDWNKVVESKFVVGVSFVL